MIKRDLQSVIQRFAKTYPVVTITGPRQSGKTTLAKMAFPSYTYCNLEHPENRLLAEKDPKSFFKQFPLPLIIDEIQRVPEILSYIQVMVDEEKKNGAFILTGSHQLTLNASISQSLAGRTALVTLFPFSLNELNSINKNFDRDELLFNGFMPRIYDQNQEPTALYRNYLHTYVERDVRQLIHLRDLFRFENFIRLLAGRIGQVVNVASLASDTGVSSPTISDWLSVLEASYIIYRLQPYYHNMGKRIIKSPKLYFVDVGLASYLLGIESVKQIARDHAGKDANLYFFRDNHQNEVDLLYKSGQKLVPIEIKASRTYNTDFHKGISHFFKIKEAETKGHIIYAGEKTMNVNNIYIHHFKDSKDIFSE
jgi:predicted AAA+ superfamily ATPase